jgi:hypothetical protein
MIKKVKGGYRVIGNNTGKNLGTFKTKAAAAKHQVQVQYFMYGKPKGTAGSK